MIEILDFDTYIKVCGITALATIIGVVSTLVLNFGSLLSKKNSIEAKRRRDIDNIGVEELPSCVAADLKKVNKTLWFKKTIIIIITIIISTVTYSIFKNKTAHFGEWYIIIIASISYFTAFGPFIWLVAIIFEYYSLFLRVTEYENHPDINKYKCKR